ncbi:uncharacterized protein P884DRAFT_78308 [Thermothelomyces heterothallicus CBS 202.75]|uniref:uncharacterized protein n=1 Tax=Thermothelomyces heterothallicus CBS 202.75 TaxID=1149848 RepID=UPI0037437E83
MHLKAKGRRGVGNQDATASGNPTLDKAQRRRAQVRRAQTQHRQRKADYVRHLEKDIARIRDMIEAAEQDTRALLNENKTLREQLLQTVGKGPSPVSLDQGVALWNEMPQPSQLSSGLLQEPGTVTIALGFDEVLNVPAFYVSSPSPSCNPHQPASQRISQPDADDFPDLTPAQTQAAINFILALEHICRAHFLPCLYDPTIDTSTPIFGFEESGHTLMATSMALRNAPEHIFDAVARTDRGLFPNPGPPPVMCPIRQASPATTTAATAAAATTAARATATTMTTTLTQSATADGMPNEKGGGSDGDGDAGLSWTTTTLTLRSLRGLASSLVPDSAELAPVQAWFELAGRFGVARLADRAVLDALKRELAGAVRCPHFGALIDRASFESAVGRVLGTPT